VSLRCRIAGMTPIFADNRPVNALVSQRLSNWYTHGHTP
jgi:hypothetical protein